MSQPFDLLGKISTLLTLSLKGILFLQLSDVNKLLDGTLTAVSIVYISIKIYLALVDYRKGNIKSVQE